MELILVTGGARSGKSSFAQKLALQQEARSPEKTVIYLATAQAKDDEMRRRVELHRRGRPSRWQTIEEPWEPGAALETLPPECGVVLIDCLTIWLSNLLLRGLEKQNTFTANDLEGNLPGKTVETALEKHIFKKVDLLLDAAARGSYLTVLVTNEVGCGVVPEHYLGRFFRDLAGKANQQVAARAGVVYLLTCGIPLKLKG